MSLRHLRPVVLTAVLACLLGGLAAAAHADDRDWRRDRRDWHDPHHPYYVAPQPVYAPPPVVYAPPPPVSPGINLVIPLHFH